LSHLYSLHKNVTRFFIVINVVNFAFKHQLHLIQMHFMTLLIWCLTEKNLSFSKKIDIRLKKKMCLVSARVSPGPCASTFFFLQFFSDAPSDPSTPSSEYTWYHRLQNVLASINHHILYIESRIKCGIIYSIHIPFFSYQRIKFTTISLLFSPSGISLSKKTAWPHQFWRNSLTRNTFINFFALASLI
jgi:hypothetical protein